MYYELLAPKRGRCILRKSSLVGSVDELLAPKAACKLIDHCVAQKSAQELRSARLQRYVMLCSVLERFYRILAPPVRGFFAIKPTPEPTSNISRHPDIGREWF